MNTSVAHKVQLRANALRKVREFFDGRGYLEVDTPALSPYASVDSYIEPFKTSDGSYLHTSPELAMKRLLAEGSGNIYFLGHVFREEENGSLHNSEFTMVEWYRTNTDEKTFLKEVCDLHFLFLGTLPVQMLSYDEAWRRYAKTPDRDISSWREEEQRHYIFATSVEPNLGVDELTIIANFPKEEALLANTRIIDGKEVAARYEFYFRGIELANGFFELSDSEIAASRFKEANRLRHIQGKPTLPLDPHFLSALAKGLPENTYGIAAGFDRLLMLQEGARTLHDILPLNRSSLRGNR